MNRSEILDTAKLYITKDRAATHGSDAEDSFSTIAAFWAAYLNRPIYAEDVCIMMCLLKIARFKNNPAHIDNSVDLCGYSALAGEMASLADKIEAEELTKEEPPAT